jgi:hypothetical protein
MAEWNGGMECANGMEWNGMAEWRNARTENDMKRIHCSYTHTMIFRNKTTGALLNIRRDEFVNDRLYFQEIIQSAGDGAGAGAGAGDGITQPRRFSRPFDEVTNEG